MKIIKNNNNIFQNNMNILNKKKFNSKKLLIY